MGQLFSRSLYRRATVPPFLNLPVELVIRITFHLSSTPESILALSLTCKSLFHVLQGDVVKYRNQQCRQNLLLLLEKDLGERVFYCSVCRQLHTFSAWWSPVNVWRTLLGDVRHDRQIVSPGTSRSHISFAHVRLVMNRHLYGAPHGLPLANLDLEAAGSMLWTYSTVGAPLWQQRLSARITSDDDDELLLLRMTHTIEGTETNLREALDKSTLYRICPHVKPGRVHYWIYKYGLRRVLALAAATPAAADGRTRQLSEAQRRAWAESSFRTCRDELGSCTVCLTDYTTTVERAQVRETRQKVTTGEYWSGPVVDGWRVTIIAYHGVGGCRDVEDWRWVALVGHNTGPKYDFSATLGQRNATAFPPGWVRDRWQAAGLVPKRA